MSDLLTEVVSEALASAGVPVVAAASVPAAVVLLAVVQGVVFVDLVVRAESV